MNEEIKGTPCGRRWVGKLVVYGLAGMLLLFSVIAGLVWFKSAKYHVPGSFQPSEMAAAQFATQDVVGDLGGMPVKIPRHLANYVEYDSDPGWGEKRQGAVPVRTQQSKLRSFGFEVRYPDMVGLESPQMMEEKSNVKSRSTRWIHVGFNTGEDYPGDGFLERLTDATVGKPNVILKYANYEQLPDKKYGLAVYTAKGTNPKTQRPYREHLDAKDIFIYRKKSGQVETFIECSNRDVIAPPCTHTINLEPHAKAWVRIDYRRGLLPEWQSIQESVTKLILSFKANNSLDVTSAKQSALNNSVFKQPRISQRVILHSPSFIELEPQQ